MSEQFLEVDLRGLTGRRLLGRRCQLEFETRLVFKADGTYRETPSMVELWADLMVGREDQSTSPRQLGRAVLADPALFTPPSNALGRRPYDDPWTRSVDRLVVDLDYWQLDEIEEVRRGAALVFSCTLGGIVHHEVRSSRLYPANHHLKYRVSESDWTRLLTQLEYGRYVTLDVRLPTSGEVTGDLGTAARALEQALAAFHRGDYEEAVADCRPGLTALARTGDAQFKKKPWSHEAGKAERFWYALQGILKVANAAHHPEDRVRSDDANAQDRPSERLQWERADAFSVIAILAALIRQRSGRG